MNSEHLNWDSQRRSRERNEIKIETEYEKNTHKYFGKFV